MPDGPSYSDGDRLEDTSRTASLPEGRNARHRSAFAAPRVPRRARFLRRKRMTFTSSLVGVDAIGIDCTDIVAGDRSDESLSSNVGRYDHPKGIGFCASPWIAEVPVLNRPMCSRTESLGRSNKRATTWGFPSLWATQASRLPRLDSSQDISEGMAAANRSRQSPIGGMPVPDQPS
jgi:hypothetical protein